MSVDDWDGAESPRSPFDIYSHDTADSWSNRNNTTPADRSGLPSVIVVDGNLPHLIHILDIATNVIQGTI